MGCACLCGRSQFFNPYQQQQMNQQAYEWGRRLAQEQQERQDAQDARSVNGCLARIGKAIARAEFSEAEEWAEKLLNLRTGLGYYYLGLTNELQGYNSYAKSYYQKGANAGNKTCRSELKRISEQGFATSQQIDNVVAYYAQLNAMTYNMAAQMTNNIWGNSSSSGSSYYESSPNRSRSAQKANCSTCHGTGYDPTPYTHSASADSYLNSAGYRCPYCGRSTKHYHYRCPH